MRNQAVAVNIRISIGIIRNLLIIVRIAITMELFVGIRKAHMKRNGLAEYVQAIFVEYVAKKNTVGAEYI